MTSLDTNVILRLFLNDVPAQTKKVQEFISNSDDVYITDIVVVEVIFVLEKTLKIKREIIAALFRDLFATRIVHSYLIGKTIDMFKRHPALSIVDCYASIETEAYQNKLVTFDKKLAHQGGTHITLL